MQRRLFLLILLLILCWPLDCFANVIWPAFYIADSYFSFMYIVPITIILEAHILEKVLSATLKKAYLISIIVNLLSATVGLVAAMLGMLGWHTFVDPIVGDTFHIFNKIATIILMFLMTVLIEALLVRLIWKYPFKKALLCMFAGNLLSYSVIAIDLFALGGWDNSHMVSGAPKEISGS